MGYTGRQIGKMPIKSQSDFPRDPVAGMPEIPWPKHLNHVDESSSPTDGGTSRWERVKINWTNRAVRAVRSMFAGDLRGASIFSQRKTTRRWDQANNLEKSATKRVAEKVDAFVDRSKEFLLPADQAYRCLMKGKAGSTAYVAPPRSALAAGAGDVRVRGQVVPLEIHELSMPERGHVGVIVQDVSPRVEKMLTRIKERVLKDPSSIDAEVVKDTPVYEDPSLRCKEKKAALVYEMWRRGMITFTDRFGCEVGVFAVHKKTTKVEKEDGEVEEVHETRMVVDCRKTDRYFQRPPRVNMASPSAMSKLDLSPSVCKGRVLESYAADVPCFFYQLLLYIGLAPWFIIKGVTTAMVSELAARDGLSLGVDVEACPYCALRVTPMGWSWAPWVAQTTLEDILACSPLFLQVWNCIQDRGAVPSFISFEYLFWCYLDDFLIAWLIELAKVTGESEIAKNVRKVMRDHFETKGLKLHKEETGLGVGLSIGMSISALRHELRGEAKKLALLARGTDYCARQQLVSSEELEVILGSWAWQILPSRVGYSVFSASYAYVYKYRGKGPQRLWRTARDELLTASAIAPLLSVDLTAAWSPVALMGDATEDGFGLVSTPTTEDECRREELLSAESVWGEELVWRLHKEEQEQQRKDALEPVHLSAVDTARAERVKRGKGLLVAGVMSENVVIASRAEGAWWTEAMGGQQGKMVEWWQKKVVDKECNRISCGNYFAVIIGPTWPNGKRGQEAMEQACRIVSVCEEASVAWMIWSRERDPCWTNVRLKSLMDRSTTFQGRWDNCAYGDGSRRPMRMITSLRGMLRMERRCACEDGHGNGCGESTPLATVNVGIQMVKELKTEAFEGGVLLGKCRYGDDSEDRVEASLPAWREVKRWKLLFSGRFENAEGIAIQELRTVTLGLRWCARSLKNWGRKLLFFTDSMSNLGSVNKGRSNKMGMLRLLRRIGAISLVTNIRLRMRYVVSEWNFADGPSRGEGVACVARDTMKEHGREMEEV